MTIKNQLPWPLRVAVLGFMAMIGAAVVMWTYELSRDVSAGPDRRQLQEKLEEIVAERDRLSSAVNASESRLNMERAAQQQLAAQVRSLESENVRLKEDLAFFERLLPANSGAAGIAIRRLKADMVTPRQLRYRLLIMQGGRVTRDFAGSLQLAVTVVQDGNSAMIVFPDGNSSEAEQVRFRLAFRQYQHLDGILTLPEGAVIKSVQARVLEKGQLRAQQSVNL